MVVDASQALTVGVGVLAALLLFLLARSAIAGVYDGDERPRTGLAATAVAWRQLRLPFAVTVAAALGVPAAPVGPLRHGLTVTAIVAAAWVAVAAVRTVEEVVVGQLDLDTTDNLRSRRRLTQMVVLRRVAVAVITGIAVAAVLLTFEGARTIGASLLASAGIAGLLFGLAGRFTLAQFAAGLQIVFAEPIRLDDVVVIEGEWGNVEEITLTYVVVRVWDRRRLVVPTTYFVEQPFQNWTRRQAQVLGTIVLHLDHRAPIAALRTEFERDLQRQPLWDGDVRVLQVIDTHPTTIEVRALVSASSGPAAWDLRCAVREHLVTWLAEHHPSALPTTRLLPAPTADDREAEHLLAAAGDPLRVER